jgi:hypothetical protein
VKTFFAFLMFAAMCCTYHLSKDITGSIRQGIEDRKSFAAQLNEDSDGPKFRATGFLAQTLTVDVEDDPVTQDAIEADILHGEDAQPTQLREILQQLGFQSIRTENSAPHKFDFQKHSNPTPEVDIDGSAT